MHFSSTNKTFLHIVFHICTNRFHLSQILYFMFNFSSSGDNEWRGCISCHSLTSLWSQKMVCVQKMWCGLSSRFIIIFLFHFSTWFLIFASFISHSILYIITIELIPIFVCVCVFCVRVVNSIWKKCPNKFEFMSLIIPTLLFINVI